ncbi:DUF1080 domain-containing protein [Chryseolinea sp. T2]|uniref:3-keto-disaccharide hydrolase n=1 Tax=Chryseolinea sp. T2 TaxID=3129255 RepID=UPI003076B823
MNRISRLRMTLCASLALACGLTDTATAQQRFVTTPIDLTSMNAFVSPAPNWTLAAGVNGSFEDASLKIDKGTGVLVNQFNPKIQFKPEANLVSKLEHGDLFLSLDFMMPKGSNAGIYLQGRYEVQLFDSWKSSVLHVADCGSIYERWDDSRPEGKKGFEGHAPDVNASFAPNLWQHLEIQFQAPRFSSDGKKISPARFIKVTLNGVILHENVIVNGPTRSSAFQDEKASGPLVIQGDHGPLAMRNINYALLNDFKVELTDLQYVYYEGKFNSFADLTEERVTRRGKANAVDVTLADNINAAGLIFTGKFQIAEQRPYQFIVQRWGHLSLSVDGKEVIRQHDLFGEESVWIDLAKGEHTFVLTYMKNYSWAPSGIGFLIGTANARPFAMHAEASIPVIPPEPLIAIEPQREPEIIRSFMFYKGKKKTHVLSVGLPEGINYALNLDQGAIMKVWRGPFLNATDMWYERGEPQTSAPMGAVVDLSGKAPIWPDGVSRDSVAMAYEGYTLDGARIPTFMYSVGSLHVADLIKPASGNDGLTRTLTFSGPSANATVVLGEGSKITKIDKRLYVIDQRYYIRLADDRSEAQIVSGSSGQVLILPLKSAMSISYSIIW